MDSIQYLTRRGATCTDLLSCLYGLKPMELQVFYELVRRGSASVDEVSSEVGRDRTTVHRSLSKLVTAGLAYRRSASLKDGGYRYVYAAVEASRVKEQAEERVKEITASLQSLVDNFEKDMSARLGARTRAIVED
jgi:predicted transcriptional regulator